MSDIPRSNTIADFAQAVASAKSKAALNAVGVSYRDWLAADGISDVCREIYAIRQRELSAQAAEGGAG